MTTFIETRTARGMTGELGLDFTYDADRGTTVMRVARQHPPLKVVRAFPQNDGSCLVHLHNISGGILGGDNLETRAHIGSGASVQLTTTSATRVYRTAEHSTDAMQNTAIEIEEGGLLEYVPDQLIPFAHSRYKQRSTIKLAEGAGLFWWEVLAPGRVAHGEYFDYDRLQLDLTICAARVPIAIERVCIEPGSRSVASLARLGDYSYLCSFYICKVGLPTARWLQLERELALLAQELTIADEVQWGVSTLAAHGLVIKAISKSGNDLGKGLFVFWQRAKQALYGREARMPRKIY
jgi:urease accessory protein